MDNAIPNFDGRYRMELCSETSVSVGVRTKKERFILKADVEVCQDGKIVHAIFYPKSVTLPEIAGFAPILSDALLQSEVPSVKGIGRLAGERGQIRLVSESVVVQLGLRMPKPSHSEIPQSASHPWVKNGSSKEPGVRLRVKPLFKVYAGMVASFSVDVVWNNGVFSGDCDLEYNYEIYSDNLPVISAAQLASRYKKKRKALTQSSWVKAYRV